MENGHEGSDDDPDEGHDGEDLDRQSDGRRAEEAPVHAEDSELGAKKRESVEELDQNNENG